MPNFNFIFLILSLASPLAALAQGPQRPQASGIIPPAISPSAPSSQESEDSLTYLNFDFSKFPGVKLFYNREDGSRISIPRAEEAGRQQVYVEISSIGQKSYFQGGKLYSSLEALEAGGSLDSPFLAVEWVGTSLPLKLILKGQLTMLLSAPRATGSAVEFVVEDSIQVKSVWLFDYGMKSNLDSLLLLSTIAN